MSAPLTDEKLAAIRKNVFHFGIASEAEARALLADNDHHRAEVKRLRDLLRVEVEAAYFEGRCDEQAKDRTKAEGWENSIAAERLHRVVK